MNTPFSEIATYNLQKCVGLDMRGGPDRSLAVIAALGAQLVVLQEADKRLPPRPAALPHDMVEAEGWRILPFGAPGGSLGWHGNAMLMRPVCGPATTGAYRAAGAGAARRVLADLDTPIGPLRVVGCIWGWCGATACCRWARSCGTCGACPMPTVLAGDFNEWGGRAAHRRGPGHAVRRHPAQLSGPAPGGAARPDRPLPGCSVAAGGTIMRPARAYRLGPPAGLGRSPPPMT